MAVTVIVDIAEPLAEGSDYLVEATLVGPDGETPVEPGAVATITATLRSLEGGGVLIFENRDVLAYLGSGGEFSMPLTNTDTVTIAGEPRFQRRQLTIEMVQTNGKARNHAVRFAVENLVDV